MEYKEIIESCKKNGIKMIDLKFVDLPGAWQHFTIPISQFDESILKEGTGFDGSSIRGFKEINESDMLLVPDADTFQIDTFGNAPVASLICNVHEPDNLKRFESDPRHIAQKAEKFLAESGIADKAYFGPEAEFFIFDSVKFNSDQNHSYHHIGSCEAGWLDNGDIENGHGNIIRNKEGYFPVAPLDQMADIRREMVAEMEKFGIEVEKEHHEVATAGQAEIDIKYDTLVSQADKLMLFKYAVKNVAKKYGKTATFMPKPLYGDNGSGMHTHISLWKDSTPLFFDKNGYAGLSKNALYFIGGLLKHGSALMALVAPTVNSYKRLVPGFEAPVNLVYSARNRSAAVRIPMYSDSPASKRLEFRPPDATCNPYLAFAAMLMAGIDGIKQQIDPGDPVNGNIYSIDKNKVNIPHVPDSLQASLEALKNDHDFLLEGGVFTKELVNTWINYKLTAEYDYIRTRPTPAEFILYYNI